MKGSLIVRSQSRTACWVILTLGLGCSAWAEFSGDVRGLLPGLHTSGLPRLYIVKIAIFYKDDGHH